MISPPSSWNMLEISYHACDLYVFQFFFQFLHVGLFLCLRNQSKTKKSFSLPSSTKDLIYQWHLGCPKTGAPAAWKLILNGTTLILKTFLIVQLTEKLGRDFQWFPDGLKVNNTSPINFLLNFASKKSIHIFSYNFKILHVSQIFFKKYCSSFYVNFNLMFTWTVGLILVSNSSLIIATVSESSS